MGAHLSVRKPKFTQNARLIGRRWPFGRAAASLVAAVLVVVAGWAAPAAADVEVQVTTPTRGLSSGEGHFVLIVTVRSDQASEGTIAVSDSNTGGLPLAVVSVEVPGGSDKQVLIPLPASRSASYSVTVDLDGEKEKRQSFSVSDIRQEQPVAVFPGLVSDDLLTAIDIESPASRAQLIPFDEAWLDAGPAALANHAAVIMTEGDFEALNEGRRSALFHWVSYGGTLHIDAPAGTPPAGLPAAISADGVGWVGAGSVRLTGSELRSGNLSGIVAARRLGSEDTYSGDYGLNNGFGAGDALRQDSTVKVFQAGWLIALLGLYVLLIGPILWFWLKRTDRQPAMWVVIPAAALITTIGIWGVGSWARRDATGSQVTMVMDIDGYSQSMAQYLLVSGSGGRVGVKLDDGWMTALPPSDDYYYYDSRSSGTLRDDSVTLELTPGSAGTLAASGWSANSASWDIEATQDDSLNITGSATNTTDQTMDEVMVTSRFGLYEHSGEVRPGESIKFVLNRDQLDIQRNVVRRLQSSSGVSPEMYAHAIHSVRDIDVAGAITVIGWSRDSGNQLPSLDGQKFNGRTGYMSLATVPSWPDDSQSGLAGRVRTVSDDGESYVYVVEVAPGVPKSAKLQLSGGNELDMWVGGRWIKLTEVADGRNLVPEAVTATGVFYIREQRPTNESITGDLPYLTVTDG